MLLDVQQGEVVNSTLLYTVSGRRQAVNVMTELIRRHWRMLEQAQHHQEAPRRYKTYIGRKYKRDLCTPHLRHEGSST